MRSSDEALLDYISTFRIQSVVVEQKEELHIGFLVTNFFPALVHHVIYASKLLDSVPCTYAWRLPVGVDFRDVRQEGAVL